jgi:murein DD-endopeptidase MepM/ murein hydrolase activator NlpD
MLRVFSAVLVLLVLGGFWWATRPAELPAEQISWDQFWLSYLEPQLPVAGTFSLPLFPPSGNGAYVKRGFRERQNLGEDWALEPGKAAGDVTVVAVADGVVILADDLGAVWGKVVILLHRMPDGAPWPAVESMYANMAALKVSKGDIIAKGTPVGTLGPTQVAAVPELHFEIRTELGYMLGPGEAGLAEGWVNPAKFIEEWKGK